MGGQTGSTHLKEKENVISSALLYLTVENLHGQNYGTEHVIKNRFHYQAPYGFQWLCGYRVGVG